MNNIQFDKSMILEYLQDEDIIKRILDITNNSSTDKEISNEEKNIEEIDKLKEILKSKEQQIEELEGEKEKYKNISYIYNQYISLSDETKEEVRGIFKKETIESFLFCGAQFENIKMLWDYIKNKIIENENTDIENLKLIFDYFFNQYNGIHEEELYSRLEVNINEEFDTDVHIRCSHSKASGEIKEILLVGYKNKYTDKIEKKSVVRL